MDGDWRHNKGDTSLEKTGWFTMLDTMAPRSTTDTTLNDRWWDTLWSQKEKNGYKHVGK